MARLDELIKQDIIDLLVRDDRVDASRVDVEVNNGEVTLKGEVPTYFSRSSAYEDARGVLGVTNATNQLMVNYPPDVSVPTDSEVEDSIRNILSTNPDINLVDMDVSVENGTVTLSGSVDAYWKKIHAEELVSNEPSVALIENHLTVVPSDDIFDKTIAESIIDSLEAKASVDADDVNVKLNDGDVTLTGSVPSFEARKAADEASFYTAGVTHVTNRLSITGA